MNRSRDTKPNKGGMVRGRGFDDYEIHIDRKIFSPVFWRDGFDVA